MCLYAACKDTCISCYIYGYIGVKRSWRRLISAHKARFRSSFGYCVCKKKVARYILMLFSCDADLFRHDLINQRSSPFHHRFDQ